MSWPIMQDILPMFMQENFRSLCVKMSHQKADCLDGLRSLESLVECKIVILTVLTWDYAKY